MDYEVFMSLLMNISILVLIAEGMTSLTVFRRILAGELYGGLVEGRFSQKGKEEPADERRSEGEPGQGGNAAGFRMVRGVLLGVCFGLFCIVSDRIGVQMNGSIPNARVIGILSAGILGGPEAGILTSLIAALHRYLVFPQRASTLACIAATFIQGFIGAALGEMIRHGKMKSQMRAVALFLAAFAAGLIHLILVYTLVEDRVTAVEIVRSVMIPMLIMNSLGIVIFFGVFNSAMRQSDLEAAAKVSNALRIAEQCTPFLRNGLEADGSADEIVNIIRNEEPACEGAAIVKDCRFLARSEEFGAITLSEDNYPRLLMAAKTYKNTRISHVPVPEDAFYPLYGKSLIMAAPIQPDEANCYILVMLFRRGVQFMKADEEVIGGLAHFLTSQLQLAQMDHQKDELQKAEYRALQSQINPHFLFNALNTISCFCREKPDRARELLQSLSSYFRNMLTDSNKKVTLEKEMEHVEAYLELEKARFEERLIVEVEAEPQDCICRVPNLILQPIVENAVHHGAMQREVGRVSIRIHREEINTLIDVEDNGPGIPQYVLDRLHGAETESFKSIGIGMLNVQERLRAVYGKAASMQILTGESGTTVRLVLPNNLRTEEDAE